MRGGGKLWVVGREWYGENWVGLVSQDGLGPRGDRVDVVSQVGVGIGPLWQVGLVRTAASLRGVWEVGSWVA